MTSSWYEAAEQGVVNVHLQPNWTVRILHGPLLESTTRKFAEAKNVEYKYYIYKRDHNLMDTVCALTTSISRQQAEEITEYKVIQPGWEIEFDPWDDSLSFKDLYNIDFMVGIVAYPPNWQPVFYKMNLVWVGHDFGKNTSGGISISIWLAILFFLIVFLLAFLVYRLRMRVKATERWLEFEMNDVWNLATVGHMSMRDLDTERTNGIIED